MRFAGNRCRQTIEGVSDGDTGNNLPGGVTMIRQCWVATAGLIGAFLALTEATLAKTATPAISP